MWCQKAYADERQRQQVSAGILLSFISGSRLVSLFDTRVKEKPDDEEVSISGQKEDVIPAKGATIEDLYSKVESWVYSCTEDGSAASQKRKRSSGEKLTRRTLPMWTRSETNGSYSRRKPDSTAVGCVSDIDLGSRSSRYSARESIFSENSDGMDTDTQYMEYDSAVSVIVSSVDSKNSVKANADSDYGGSTDEDWSDVVADDSSVTDDGYDAGPEEARVIVWRHISFHIVRNHKLGQPNTLLAKVTLLHTKGEDRKPRMYEPLATPLSLVSPRSPPSVTDRWLTGW